jgi:Uma2 family endonuclease
MYNDTNLLTVPTHASVVLDTPSTAPSIAPRRYTLAEYLRLEEASQELHEYYDGIIIKLPMARTPHNLIVGNTVTAFNIAKKTINKKLLVLTGQQAVYLPKFNFSLYPDVLVVCEKPQHFDTNQVLLINPIIIVEVLSKSTQKYDRTTKFEEYKTLDSFEEYVLINQKKCHVVSRFKDSSGKWYETIVKDIHASIFLKSIGCSISLEDIYDNIVL